MHLNDEQLLELDQSGHLHIDQCESCRQRASNLNEMRQVFQSMPDISLPSGGWQEIQKIQNERQQFSDLKRTRQQLTRWKIGSLALAASLTAIMLWPVSHTPPLTSPLSNQQLNALIEQNRYLQQQLDLTLETNNQTNVSYQMLKMDIQSIDQSIQRAYLQGDSDEQKSSLWEIRKQLVDQLLSNDKKIQTIRI